MAGYDPYKDAPAAGGGYTAPSGGYDPYGPAPPPATADGGGGHSGIDGWIIGTLGHIIHRTPANLRDIAYEFPGGIAQLAAIPIGTEKEAYYTLTGQGKKADLEEKKQQELSKNLVKGYAKSIYADVLHPLRNPVYTALDILPFVSGGASTVARAGQAGRAVEAGESASRAFLTNPAKANERVIVSPTGATALGHYSRSGLGFATQRGIDTLLQHGAARGEPGGFVETRLNKRIDKWTQRQLRVEQAIADVNSTKLWAAGSKLDPHESRALRFVAEKVPISKRLSADAQRVEEARGRVGAKPGSDPRTVKRLEERQQWGRDALQFLDIDKQTGIATFKDTAEGQRLAHIYGLMENVVGDREGILKALDLMDEASLQAAKTKAGRFAAGGKYVEPTAARLGRAPSVVEAERRVAKLQKRYDRLVENKRPGYQIRDRARSRAEAETHLNELKAAHDKALNTVAEGMFGPISKQEVASRNVKRGKAKSQHARTAKSLEARGFKSPTLKLDPTVKEERLAEAQRKIDEAIARNPDHPVLQRWAEREAEIAQLEKVFTPDPEALFGEGPKPRPRGGYGRVADKVATYKASPHVERAGSALSVAKDDLERARAQAARHEMPTGIVGGEVTVPEDALYIGSPRQVRPYAGEPRVSSRGTAGHTRDESLKTSKGTTIQYGLDEPNVAKIVASRGKAAVKLKMLARRMEEARKGGTKVPTHSDDVFVWNDNQIVSNAKIPADVREFLTDPEKYGKSPDVAEGMLDQARAMFMKFADHKWELDPEYAQTLADAAEGKGVFVQRSLLGDFGKPLPTRLTGKIATSADVVNNIQKSLLIYLKANYLVVQGLSNAAMNFVQQGPAAPINIAHAGKIMHADPELAAMAGEVMGTGALMQLAGEAGKGSRVATASAAATQRLAHWMSHYVDGPARLSAFLYEAKKAGFSTPKQIRELLTNEEHAQTLGEVAQRAKEAIVDYSEMSATERNFIRRMFFVYPWLKGSTKYAGHFLRDHPVQAAVLGQLAQSYQSQNADFRASLPSYLRGSFRAGGGLVNPSGWNPAQTPASIGEGIVGAFTGNPDAPEGAQFLTPALALALGLFTKRNTLGIPLKGSAPSELRQMLLDPTFAAQLARAIARSSGAGVDSKGQLQNPLLAGLIGPRTVSSTFPDPNDPYWRFLFGGLYPRAYDEGALRRAKALQGTNR